MPPEIHENPQASLTAEQYGMQFYMQYLAHWPEYFQIAVAPNGDLMGYSEYI